MRFLIALLFYSSLSTWLKGQELNTLSDHDIEYRVRKYVESLRVIDTHEHLFSPEIIKNSYFLDFSLLFQTNAYEDLISAGMPEILFDSLFNEPITPLRKWRLIEPYWRKTFNTSFCRTILNGVKSLYNINDLNESTVTTLSEKIRNAYSTNWFDRILRDSCRFDYIIQDGYHMNGKGNYFRYAKRFDSWITIKSNYRIDSLAILQIEPIFTLEDYVRSLRTAFEKEVRNGMTVVKVFIAYSRKMNSDKVDTDAARKVFRTLVNGDEDLAISFGEAKPLQDYMLFRLLDLAREYSIPVAFHTGLMAGEGRIIGNADPTLLANIFNSYPEVNFVLYHGAYPFGGELSTLAKNYHNVYIDMNWTWSISPSYSERYLTEWLETVPAGKLMAFGGDLMVPENIYSELKTAKKIISDVLCNKIREGYFTEAEARSIARMILHDNAAAFYKLE